MKPEKEYEEHLNSLNASISMYSGRGSIHGSFVSEMPDDENLNFL